MATAEGVFPKIGNDPVYASEVNTFMSAIIGGDLESGGINDGETRYLGVSGHQIDMESNPENREFIIPRDGTIQNLYVDLTGSNTLDGNLEFEIRVNNANSGVIVTWTAGQVGVKTDLSNTVAVSAGDVIEIRFQAAGSSGSANPTSAQLLTWGFEIIQTE